MIGAESKVHCESAVRFVQVDRQFVIPIHQIVHGFTHPPIQKQYVIQGMGERNSMAEDESEKELRL